MRTKNLSAFCAFGNQRGAGPRFAEDASLSLLHHREKKNYAFTGVSCEGAGCVPGRVLTFIHRLFVFWKSLVPPRNGLKHACCIRVRYAPVPWLVRLMFP